ncbi:MAG: DUF2207 domain-containing protein, partial [Syntrophobacterales bacterium]
MRYFLKLAVLILALFVISPLAVQSADSPFYWEFINVEIELQENGDILVTETQKYVFTAPHTNERYRYIPLDKVDGIEDVEVLEDGQLLWPTTGVEKNQFWIRWSHELNPPEVHTFVLKYRVIGGLHIRDAGDQVYWKAIFKDRKAPIQRGKVTIRLPAVVSERILSFNSFGLPADARQVDARTIEVSCGSLSPGKELEVQVTFAHGILAVNAPHWQKETRGRPLSKSNIVGLVFAGVSALILLFVGIHSWYLDQKYGVSKALGGGGFGGGWGGGGGCGGGGGG